MTDPALAALTRIEAILTRIETHLTRQTLNYDMPPRYDIDIPTPTPIAELDPYNGPTLDDEEQQPGVYL